MKKIMIALLVPCIILAFIASLSYLFVIGFPQDSKPHSYVMSTLCSLISSFIFLPLVFFLLRPRVFISSNIACANNDSRFPGEIVYQFKIINGSFFFNTFDIRLKLWACEEYVINGKNNIKINDLPLVRDNLFIMKSLMTGNPYLDKNSQAACTFTTKADLPTYMHDDNKFIQLQVVARHGLSGLSGVFTKVFYTNDVINNGKFKHGLTFAI
jgi:hypothetical protein